MRDRIVFQILITAAAFLGPSLHAQTNDSCAQGCVSRAQWTTPYEQQNREQQERYRREWQERQEQYQRNQQDQQQRQQSNPRGTYGALAYSAKTGDYGFSYGFGSRAEAERRAKRECGQNDCEIAAWYSRACGAIAAGDDGKWGGGSGDTEREAREDAKNDCVKDGGKNCEIIVAKCTR